MFLKCIKPSMLLFGFISIGIILVFVPAIISLLGWEFFDLSEESSSNIGNAIGGMTAPIVGMLAAFLTFCAFWVQYVFNEEQNVSIKTDLFERKLFEMINIHEGIVNSLRLDIEDEFGQVGLQDKIIIRKEGRDVFRLLYELYPINTFSNSSFGIIIESGQRKGLRELFEKDSNSYAVYEMSNVVGILDHYFNQLFVIYKMIDENKDLDDTEKRNYADIVRSKLSQYELVLLYHQGLSSGGAQIKFLIERYSILKDIRKEKLANDSRLEEYNILAFGSIP